MSVKALNWAWGISCPRGSKLVLVCLADHANEQDRCWPSMGRIATQTGLSKRTILRDVATLEKAGLILVQRDSGRWNTYRLLIEKRCQDGTGVTLSPVPTGHRPVSACHRTSDNRSPDQCQPVTLTVRNPQEPSMNPQPPSSPPGGAGSVVEVSGLLLPGFEQGAAGSEGEPVDDFLEFWEAYPKKVARIDAARAWKKLSKRDREAVMDDLPIRSRCHDWVKEGGTFAPHPATYLNGRRWEDEMKEQPKVNGHSSHRNDHMAGMSAEEMGKAITELIASEANDPTTY